MSEIINKTMDRDDLLSAEAKPVVESLNRLIKNLYAKDLYLSSWYGSLPDQEEAQRAKNKIALFRRGARKVGMDNRGSSYEPLADAADDGRIPWYLYWEVYWVLTRGPEIRPEMRLLDAGGSSSLFTCHLGSLGSEIHSIDLNEGLVKNGRNIAHAMGWNVHSHVMNMKSLGFGNGFFDHAYSICVFEHLDYETRQLALAEIARCLKPGGTLSITFDYRNPAPYLAGIGPDSSEKNKLSTPADIKRSFLSSGQFRLVGNRDFSDPAKSYLVHPKYRNEPYTFGAIFMTKAE